MSTASPKVLAKVRKLMRLGASPNPHEAERANDEVKRLMEKHGLSLADIEEDVTEVADEVHEPGHLRLAHAIAVSRRCAILVNKKNQLAFRGRSASVRSAREAYQLLARTVSQHCEIGPRDPGRHVWRLCYWSGFVEAVVKRLVEEEIKPTTSVALAQMPTEPVPSLRQQTNNAIHDFAAHFLPEDVQVAIQRLCRDAYENGNSLGRSVTIEKFHRPAPVPLPDEAKKEDTG